VAFALPTRPASLRSSIEDVNDVPEAAPISHAAVRDRHPGPAPTGMVSETASSPSAAANDAARSTRLATSPAAASPTGLTDEPLSAPIAPAAAPAPAAPAVLTAVPTTPAAPAYRDGTYYGWGTSRHGDIQAAVVVDGGRITSAKIAQCLTRYSCSWIAALPPQVISRQSPEVDYVSGATQSTNAFYYAVIDALAKAK
jgi:uncharacterized protein with FMN-binding domain